jgi:hypothetical protein
VKYKYKLLKAINSKYNLISAHKQNRTQKRFKNGTGMGILIDNNNDARQDRGLNTVPDILEMLDQLKQYLDDTHFKVSLASLLFIEKESSDIKEQE